LLSTSYGRSRCPFQLLVGLADAAPIAVAVVKSKGVLLTARNSPSGISRVHGRERAASIVTGGEDVALALPGRLK